MERKFEIRLRENIKLFLEKEIEEFAEDERFEMEDYFADCQKEGMDYEPKQSEGEEYVRQLKKFIATTLDRKILEEVITEIISKLKK